MQNQYISKGNKLIKNDLESVLLYFDYVSPGILLPKQLNYRVLRLACHKTLRTAVILIFYLKLFRFFYKIKKINDDALIIIGGSSRNIVKIVLKNKNYKVLKIIKSKRKYQNEKSFYERYKGNKSLIKLPNYEFHKNNTIEIDFIKLRTFNRLIVDGSMSIESSLVHFKVIKNELYKMYKKKHALVHGDLNPVNILVDHDFYYLIDFSDARVNYFEFDLYVLMFSILSVYKYLSSNARSIFSHSLKKINVSQLIGIERRKLLLIEKQYRKLRGKYSKSEYKEETYVI